MGAFPTVPLGELFEAMSGQSLTPEEQEKNPGPYPVVSGGREPSKTYYKSNRDANTISVSKFGSYAGFVRWNTTPYWALGAFTLKNKQPDRFLDKYLYYYLSINNTLLYNFQRKGPTTNFYWSDVVDLLIPLPPLPIQQEIVSALDNLYNTSTTAKAAAESVKAQMVAVVRSISQRGYEQKKLGDLATGDNGKGLSMQETKANPGSYPILSGGQNYCGTFGKFNRNENTISVSKSGSSSGFVKWNATKFWASDCFTISSKDQAILLDQFLFYVLSLQQDAIYQNYQIKGTIPHCYWKDLESMMIPVPPSSVQQQVLDMLNEMDAERKMLEQIAAKVEDRAKFLLDGYLVSVSPQETELVYNENGEIVFH